MATWFSHQMSPVSGAQFSNSQSFQSQSISKATFTMYAKIFTVAMLSASVAATQGFTNAHSFGAMLKRGDVVAKRQGYYPQSDLCNGDGTTCPEVCGANTAECPSNDANFLRCHSTNDGSHCCTDGTGNACGPGDYCTNDGAGNTYCCPEGITTDKCAEEFGISVSLIPDAPTVAVPSPVGSTAIPVASLTAVSSAVSAVTPVSSAIEDSSSKSDDTIKSSIKSSTKSSTTPAPILSTPSASTASSTSPNATSSGSLPQFTGGATKVGSAGIALLVGGAGLMFL
ncbi:Prp 4 c domain-containing [Pyrenophora seminiperda CCB06]|uniref:Prp 4 c domain-containing n=1 Tax=Pyrenophora seminiperda CCB06 TaxID=1302712 RepID=A0A3M7LVR2_9PLEO|nr:Prp 4 c domain-containing [Pyrenophora seminiperda CCB06]